MAAIIELQEVGDTDNTIESIFFLLKEETFPREGLEMIQQRIKNAITFDNVSKEELFQIAKDTIEEYKSTIIPFSLYIIKFKLDK